MNVSIKQLVGKSKTASIQMAALSSDKKNTALKCIAEAIISNQEKIIEKNKIDILNAEHNNISAPLLKRLKFDIEKINDVVTGLYSLINLPDPVGQVLSETELDHGLELFKVTCPIGVIGIIFESRPDALVQISSLCLKSGNTVLLKGGSEAANTNRILVDVLKDASEKVGLPGGWIQLFETRADVNEMLSCDQYIDLIIPRGSNEFVRYIMNHSAIPVLGHADGICHVYVDDEADIEMAIKIIVDSKIQYVTVCNAAETLLIHERIAGQILPVIKDNLDKYKVQLVGCEKTASFIKVVPANEDSWRTEYLDYKLSVKVVSDLDDAINHINLYGSKHTDSIITRNKVKAEQFMNLVDSANVFWNCSTRFSDGYRYGLGAEVGVSTSKIHARGPVGLEGLVIYKWKLVGNGHTVADYAEKRKSFTHKKIK